MEKPNEPLLMVLPPVKLCQICLTFEENSVCQNTTSGQALLHRIADLSAKTLQIFDSAQYHEQNVAAPVLVSLGWRTPSPKFPNFFSNSWSDEP